MKYSMSSEDWNEAFKDLKQMMPADPLNPSKISNLKAIHNRDCPMLLYVRALLKYDLKAIHNKKK
jgi:hypothetical protein